MKLPKPWFCGDQLWGNPFVSRVPSACAFVIAALLAATAASGTVVPAPTDDTPLEEARRWFTEDPDAPMIAPKAYDVTIVQYMDYQCPACRASREPLEQLLAKDKKVRIIFRDWPIFGPASEKAARLAVAAKYQGKYVELHDALFEISLPLDQGKMETAAKKAGVNWARLQKDLETHSRDIEDLLARNELQANMLGLDGTPGFIIGKTQSFGAITLKDLEADIAIARNEAAAATSEKRVTSAK